MFHRTDNSDFRILQSFVCFLGKEVLVLNLTMHFLNHFKDFVCKHFNLIYRERPNIQH